MNLNNRVKNRFEISEILKKLLLKVGKLQDIDSPIINPEDFYKDKSLEEIKEMKNNNI